MAVNEGSIAHAFVEIARQKLTQDSPTKIRRCFEVLSQEDVWWRAHETDNSIGNLVLHLCGNVRQQIISYIGGKEDIRERPKEFAEGGPISKEDLLKTLEETLQEADRVLASFDHSLLMEERDYLGGQETHLFIIFAVVRHFAEHTGQIIYITKLRQGVDLEIFR